MKRPLVRLHSTCATNPTKSEGSEAIFDRRGCRFVFTFCLLVFATFLSATPLTFGQIQSTTSCPAGKGYWDVLSVMMMDPGLAADYHMEGITGGLPSSYVYTLWDESQSKVYYTKNPQGNPWDINLYDSNYIYQWITELQSWNGVNHWNDPKSCRKFNNASENDLADFSMRWAARCAVPGGANSSIWNPPPTVQPNNTNYYTYVDQTQQSLAQNLGYSLLELTGTGSMTITDHRATPPKEFSITTLPLIYSYSCSISGNVNSCKSHEIFEYGVDTKVNPVDNIRHSYGWVSWRLYVNATAGNPDLPAIWVLSNITISNQLMPGQVSVNFQCF
jgi:hypothetical protein